MHVPFWRNQPQLPGGASSEIYFVSSKVFHSLWCTWVSMFVFWWNENGFCVLDSKFVNFVTNYLVMVCYFQFWHFLEMTSEIKSKSWPHFYFGWSTFLSIKCSEALFFCMKPRAKLLNVLKHCFSAWSQEQSLGFRPDYIIN